MATTHKLVTLNDSTSTLVSPPGVHSGVDITIQNIDESAIAYLGAEGVTTESYGYRLEPGQAIAFELPQRDSIHVISDTDGAKVAIMQIGLED